MIFQEPMVSLNPLHTLEKQLYEVLSLHRGNPPEGLGKRLVAKFLTALIALVSARRQNGSQIIRISSPAA